MAAVYFPINNFYFCFRKYCIATLKKRGLNLHPLFLKILNLKGFSTLYCITPQRTKKKKRKKTIWGFMII